MNETTESSLPAWTTDISIGRISRRATLAKLGTLVLAGHALTLLEGCGGGTATAQVPQTKGSTPQAAVRAGKELLTYRKHTDAVLAVAWSPDGSLIASGGGNTSDGLGASTIHVWKATNGADVVQYRGQLRMITHLDWSPNGNYLASCSDDGTVHVWEATTGKHLFTYLGTQGQGAIESVWSPNGSFIASAVRKKGEPPLTASILEVWNASTGKTISSYAGTDYNIWSIAWTRDSQRLAYGSADALVQITDGTGGHLLATCKGHQQMVYAVSWSPDGTKLVSSSQDSTVRVWQIS